MIGMSLVSFLSLAVLSLIGAAALHYGARYRMLSGFDGFLGKWIVGWIGAWLGSPVLGHWGWRVGNVYAIPAIIGAFAGAFLVTASLKAIAKPIAAVPGKAQTAQTTQFEMRKAG
jgi:uncharacterized membrane protein YeaQ/YmgE (transglycosylase-associated protein family)